MPFIAYLPRGFEHDHENKAFDELTSRLKARFDSAPGLYVLVGNIIFEGNEMDAVFFKPDGIAIVEIKNYGGKICFNENTAWTANSIRVLGGTKENPFIQVRGYRIVLRRYLETRQLRFLLAPREIDWRDISAVVMFARSIEFNEVVLGDLRYWFHVTDITRIADKLASVRARSITFNAEEIRLLLGLLGVTNEHRYRTPVFPTTAPLIVSPSPDKDTIQLNYVKEFNFRMHELRMRNLGDDRFLGSEVVRQLFEQVRQGLNPFANMKKRQDNRIAGATIYPINTSCELLLIQLGTFGVPAFLGEPQEVQGWLDAHARLTVSVDELTGRVCITRVTTAPDATPLQPPTLTAENKPYLTRISGLKLEEFVPQGLARQHLLSLDETSTETEIRQALELVFTEDVRSFLFDIINLISAGDLPGAEARISLRKGQAVPAQDAGEFAEHAAAAPVNSDQVLVINELSKAELDRLLDPENFQEWMLFLHPDQRALVEADFAKPVVLKGVSGSGKTCILVHRARHLAKKYPNERIGILTLSDSLARLLQNLVNQLCGEEERRNIKVAPFYVVFRECLKHLGPEKYFAQLRSNLDLSAHMNKVLDQAAHRWPDRMVWDLDPVSHAHVGEEWDDFFMTRNRDVLDWMDPLVKYLEGLNVDASRYLEEEFTLVRSAFTVPTRQEYLAEDKRLRAGRTIPFSRERQRPDLLKLLLFWEEWMLGGGMIDALGLTQALMPLHAEMQRLPESFKFRCLLVDEYQDFSSLDVQLLRRMVPVEQPNSLFIAGDPVQKILVKRFRYLDAIVDEGSAIHKKIWKNYRNSKQILLAASRVANHFGRVAGAQGEEVEVLDPELAQRETSPPIALKTDSQIEKAWEIALKCTQTDKTDPYTVCIATASPNKISIQNILDARPASLAARRISGDCILHPEEVVVGSFADLKGFEFRLVIILGCDAKQLPDPGIPRDEIWREALRIYVAMTRGRDQVFLLYENEPSEFITVMAEAVVNREEPLLQPYERCPQQHSIQPPNGKAHTQPATRPTQSNLSPNSPAINWDENCETWFSELELEALHRYFARHVYRENLSFREWLKPRGLKTILPKLFYRIHKCPPTLVSAIIHKLSSKGLHITGVTNRR